MKRLRQIVSTTALLALLVACMSVVISGVAPKVMAQPGPGSSLLLFKQPTYGGVGSATTAASATDIFTLTGSATKIVFVSRIKCTGIATTAGVAIVQLIKRSTADTGGTSTTSTVAPNDSSDPAATAVLRQYTANPTLGTAVATLRAANVGLPLATAAANGGTVEWDFGDSSLNRYLALRGVAQQVAVNGAGATLAAGAVLTCDFEWRES